MPFGTNKASIYLFLVNHFFFFLERKEKNHVSYDLAGPGQPKAYPKIAHLVFSEVFRARAGNWRLSSVQLYENRLEWQFLT